MGLGQGKAWNACAAQPLEDVPATRASGQGCFTRSSGIMGSHSRVDGVVNRGVSGRDRGEARSDIMGAASKGGIAGVRWPHVAIQSEAAFAIERDTWPAAIDRRQHGRQSAGCGRKKGGEI